jgi:hypothetical protein
MWWGNHQAVWRVQGDGWSSWRVRTGRCGRRWRWRPSAATSPLPPPRCAHTPAPLAAQGAVLFFHVADALLQPVCLDCCVVACVFDSISSRELRCSLLSLSVCCAWALAMNSAFLEHVCSVYQCACFCARRQVSLAGCTCLLCNPAEPIEATSCAVLGKLHAKLAQ